MLAGILVGHHRYLHLSEAVDTQQGRQHNLCLATDRATCRQRLVVIGGGNLLRHTARQGHQRNLLTPASLGSHLTNVGDLPLHGEFALWISGRGFESDVGGLQVGPRNNLDGDGAILLTGQHVLLLTVGERHAFVQQVDGEHGTIGSVGRQGHVNRQQRTAVVDNQVVLVAIDDDAVDVIVVHTTMIIGTTPLTAAILGCHLVVRCAVLG